MTTTHLTGSGVVVQQRGLDVAYDIVRDVQPPQVQVMQAYSHDFNLPDKDWLPQSKELVSVMKERLSHVWLIFMPGNLEQEKDCQILAALLALDMVSYIYVTNTSS